MLSTAEMAAPDWQGALTCRKEGFVHVVLSCTHIPVWALVYRTASNTKWPGACSLVCFSVYCVCLQKPCPFLDHRLVPQLALSSNGVHACGSRPVQLEHAAPGRHAAGRGCRASSRRRTAASWSWPWRSIRRRALLLCVTIYTRRPHRLLSHACLHAVVRTHHLFTLACLHTVLVKTVRSLLCA